LSSEVLADIDAPPVAFGRLASGSRPRRSAFAQKSSGFPDQGPSRIFRRRSANRS